VDRRSHLGSVVCVGVDCAVKESVQPIVGEIVIRVQRGGQHCQREQKINNMLSLH
jgi:hypothetical protein